MPFALNCKLRGDALPTLTALRAEHLRYIQHHIAKILFGGPARGDGGAPQEMIIILRTDDRSEAEAFIHAEPYTASAKVFSEILIRPWSQIVPEVSPGALEQAIAAERAKTESQR
jgi:uncharacterized protein YciI